MTGKKILLTCVLFSAAASMASVMTACSENYGNTQTTDIYESMITKMREEQLETGNGIQQDSGNGPENTGAPETDSQENPETRPAEEASIQHEEDEMSFSADNQDTNATDPLPENPAEDPEKENVSGNEKEQETSVKAGTVELYTEEKAASKNAAFHSAAELDSLDDEKHVTFYNSPVWFVYGCTADENGDCEITDCTGYIFCDSNADAQDRFMEYSQKYRDSGYIKEMFRDKNTIVMRFSSDYWKDFTVKDVQALAGICNTETSPEETAENAENGG